MGKFCESFHTCLDCMNSSVTCVWVEIGDMRACKDEKTLLGTYTSTAFGGDTTSCRPHTTSPQPVELVEVQDSGLQVALLIVGIISLVFLILPMVWQAYKYVRLMRRLRLFAPPAQVAADDDVDDEDPPPQPPCVVPPQQVHYNVGSERASVRDPPQCERESCGPCRRREDVPIVSRPRPRAQVPAVLNVPQPVETHRAVKRSSRIKKPIDRFVAGI